MPHNQSLPSAVANALGLDRVQVLRICRYGGVKLKPEQYTTPKAIRAVKAVRLTLRQASEIWGFSARAGFFGKYAGTESLPIANPGAEHYGRTNPRLVTVKVVLEFLAEINRPARGKGIDKG